MRTSLWAAMAFRWSHLLGRPPAGGRVDDAAEAVERAGAELFHRELDVAPADVLVEEGRAVGEGLGGHVALQGPDDRAFREVGRGHAREGLLGPDRDPAGRGGEAGPGGRAEQAQRLAPRVVVSIRMLRSGHGVLQLSLSAPAPLPRERAGNAHAQGTTATVRRLRGNRAAGYNALSCRQLSGPAAVRRYQRAWEGARRPCVASRSSPPAPAGAGRAPGRQRGPRAEGRPCDKA